MGEKTARRGGALAALGVAALVATGCTASAPDEHVVIAYLGDSITEGYPGNDPALIWPSRVAADYGWQAVNLSVGGTGYIARDPATTFATRVDDVVAARPDIVVVSGGRNDLQHDQEDVAAEAAAVLDALEAGLPDATIVLTSAFFAADPPARVIETGVDRAATVALQTLLLEEVAEARDVPFIDATSVLAEPHGIVMDDGIHPNDDGQLLLAEFLGPRIADAAA